MKIDLQIIGCVCQNTPLLLDLNLFPLSFLKEPNFNNTEIIFHVT